MRMPRRSVLEDIRWGLSGALFIAAAYCAWVVVVYVLRGSAPFNRLGLSLPLALATYISVGLIAGLIVGLLRPLTRRRSGAYFVGPVAAAFGAAGVMAALSGPPSLWDFDEWVVLPILAAAGAWVIGSELWKHSDANRAVDSGPDSA
jgi:hypothetical protein